LPHSLSNMPSFVESLCSSRVPLDLTSEQERIYKPQNPPRVKKMLLAPRNVDKALDFLAV